jgi:uncharacterized OB-fold protein
MERIAKSPLAIYQQYLDKDELAYQWSPEANRAAVYATTVTYPREGAPYNVALIDVDEGFRLMSRVEDIAPEMVKIGMRVKFRVHRPKGDQASGDEPPHPVFVPLGEDA